MGYPFSFIIDLGVIFNLNNPDVLIDVQSFMSNLSKMYLTYFFYLKNNLLSTTYVLSRKESSEQPQTSQIHL